ncbi:Hypothetical protein NTJ_03291 [Nesidiocoris tenuis]|nr:Hypothetical protein NTJ_03291 [Nesidiocoris tenuis]
MEDAGCAQFYTAGGIQDKSTFVKSLETEARRVDLERATGSSHNAAPRNVGSLEGLAAAYLEKELPFFTKRAMAQLRSAGDRFCRISWEGLTHKFSGTDACQVCNLESPDTLTHLITECAVFTAQRSRLLGRATLSVEQLAVVLQLEEPTGLLKFLRTALRLRLCAMSEGAIF